MRLILLLVVLFGCLYQNQALHTVYVGQIYPNYEDWVVINNLAVDAFGIGTFNVGTLNVNSNNGVNIITSSSISLTGASIDVGGSSVSVSSGIGAPVTINAAATFDVAASSASFNSGSGDIQFTTLTNFELITTSDLVGDYSNSFTFTGVFADFQSSKGGSSFQSLSSINSQATTTSALAGNLVYFNTTEAVIQANLAINVFTSEFDATVSTFTATAQRNNILIETGTLLDISGFVVSLAASDLFTLSSLESQTLIASGDASYLYASDSLSINSDSQISFVADNGDVVLTAPGSISIYGNQGVAFQSTSTAYFSLHSSTLQVAAQTIATQANDINYSADILSSSTLQETSLYAQGDLSLSSFQPLVVSAVGEISLDANRGTLSFANSNTVATSALITFATTFGTVLSGSSVSLTPATTTFTTTGEFRLATDKEDRNVEINIATNVFTADSNLILLSGGSVYVSANQLSLSASANDVELVAVQSPSTATQFSSYNQSDIAALDITYTGGSYLWTASNLLQFTAGTTFTLQSQNALNLYGNQNINFNTQDNITLSSTHDATYLSTGNIVLGVNSLLQQFQVNAGYVRASSGGTLYFATAENQTLSGTNVDFEADADFFIGVSTDGTFDSQRFLILSGNQNYQYTQATLNSTNALLQSPPNQDITLTTGVLFTTGDTNFVGRDFVANTTTTLFITKSTVNIQSANQAPITIDNPTSTTLNSQGLYINPFKNFDLVVEGQTSFSAALLAGFFANGDLTQTANVDFSITTQEFNAFADHFNSYSTGNTVIADQSQNLTAYSLSYLSQGGDISVTTTRQLFLGSFFSKGVSNSIEFNGGETNAFNSSNAIILTADQSEILGNLAINALQGQVSYTGTDLVFYGGEFDISSFGTLTLTTPALLTVDSTYISITAVQSLTISSGTVSLTAGFNKDFSFQQNSAGGLFTISSNNLLVRSNNDLSIFSDTSFTHNAFGVDANNNAVLFQTSAQQAGIALNIGEFISTTSFNTLFVADDPTNRGGADIDLYAVSTASFTVLDYTGTNPQPQRKRYTPPSPFDVISVPDLVDYPQGILLYSSGSEYDPLLGYQVGQLYRTQGYDNPTQGGISVTAGGTVYYVSSNYNEIVTHNGLVSVQADLVDWQIGGDLEMQADRSAASFTSQLGNIAIGVDGDVQIQASSSITGTANLDTVLRATGAFSAIADGGDINFELLGSSAYLQTTANSINLEGSSNGFYNYATDTYTATAVDIFAYLSAHFIGTDESITAGINVLYVSSFGNNINFDSTASTTVDAVLGNVYVQSGTNTLINTATDSSYTATSSDITLYSAGSVQYIVRNDMFVTSVLNQIYTATQRFYLESLGQIDVGQPGNTPIITIYAGGNALDDGVVLSAVQGFSYTSQNNNQLIARNFYSSTSASTSLTSFGSATLTSTGTNGIGKDVSLIAGESLNFDAQGNIVLTAATLKFEYDDLAWTSQANLYLTAIKGILVSGHSFSTSSVTHTLNTKAGLTITANSDVAFDSQGSLSFSAHTTATWGALGQIEFNAGNNLAISSTGTNAPLTFSTKNDQSFELLQATKGISLIAGTSIAQTAVDGYLALINGQATFNVGDAFTGTSDSSVVLSAQTFLTINGNDPSSAGSDVEFNSFGTLSADVGTSFQDIVGGDLYILADKDLVFTGGKVDNNVLNNTFKFEIVNAIDVTAGGNFTFKAKRALYSAQTFDVVANSANPVTADSIVLSTTGTGSNIDVQALNGDVLVHAQQNVDLLSDYAVTLTATGSVQLLSKGTGGISFNTVELPTPINLVSRDGLGLFGNNQVTLQAYGADTASGYIDIRATGYANLGEFNPLVNGTFGLGFFSADSNIDISAPQAAVQFDDLRYLLAFPSVNGTLLLQADGHSADGYGINVESTVISVMAELNVAFEAANINFFDYGTSLYDYTTGILKPDLVSINRPTLSSYKDQTYVAYGSNSLGNAIELISSTPNAEIFANTQYINAYSGGSTLVQGEINTHFNSYVSTIMQSTGSVILQGDGINAEIGVYLTTRDYDLTGTFTGLGSNIEFNSKIDSYIQAADKILSYATEEIYFFSGTQGTVGFNFDAGAELTSLNGNLNVNTQQNTEFISSQNLEVTGQILVANSPNIYAGAYGARNGRGNIEIGNPSLDVELPTNNGEANVQVSGNDLYFLTEYVDVANTVNLQLPFYTFLPACDTANLGRTFLYQTGFNQLMHFCQCIHSVYGFYYPSNNLKLFTGNVCVPFENQHSYQA